jgi:hypothetical protein
MNGKKLLITILCIMVFLPGAFVFAQQPYDLGAVESDLTAISEGISNLFGPNLGAMTFLGDPVGYSTIKHIEIGIAGGASLVPAENVALGTNMQYDFGDLEYIPVPAIGVHAKFKIKRFEIGGKLAGLPKIEDKDAGIHINNMIIGGKLRYELWDKRLLMLCRTGASFGGFFEYINGDVSMLGRDSIPVIVDVPAVGSTQVADLVTETGFETNWKGFTVGGEGQINFQVLFVNLFGGARLSKTFGSATTDLIGSTTLALTDPIYAPYVSEFTNQALDISSEAKPEGIDTTLFGGVELKILSIVATVRGGYNFKNDNFIVDGGARLQF